MTVQVLEQIEEEKLFSEELFDKEKLKKLGLEVREFVADPVVYENEEVLYAWIE
ncbi:MAG: hypothetical protein ACP5G1_03925 [Nanopusillaceae archaeon]